MQDVVAMQSSDEDGNTQEQIFTRICLDMLSDAAETENVSVAYDERDLKKFCLIFAYIPSFDR